MDFKKIAIGGLIVSALVLAGCKTQTGGNQTQTPPTSTADESSNMEDTAPEGAAIVTVTNDGFQPSSVTVKAGESITWVNNSTRAVQVGSADHPTHTKNPALTGGEFVIELKPGETKTVSAGTSVGTWGYHDHLKASAFGKVVVE